MLSTSIWKPGTNGAEDKSVTWDLILHAGADLALYAVQEAKELILAA